MDLFFLLFFSIFYYCLILIWWFCIHQFKSSTSWLWNQQGILHYKSNYLVWSRLPVHLIKYSKASSFQSVTVINLPGSKSSVTHTHTHTHTNTLSLSLSHTHTHTHVGLDDRYGCDKERKKNERKNMQFRHSYWTGQSSGGFWMKKNKINMWVRPVSRRSCRDSNLWPFDHESGALTTELSGLPLDDTTCSARPSL